MGIDRNRFVRKQDPYSNDDPVGQADDSSANMPVPVIALQPQQGQTMMLESDSVFMPAEPQEDESVIELRPGSSRHANNEEDSGRPVVRTVLGVLTLAVLFAASVGAGAYSNYRDAKKADKVAQSTVTQKTAANNSVGQGSSLSVGAANTDIGFETPKTLSTDSPYYQYTDTFGGGKVTISRQPIPDDFRADPNGSLVRLADSLNAKQTIQTQRWGTVYMVTDAKNSVQVLLFKSSQKLVFIQSLAIHSTDEWQKYIDSLTV